MKHATPFLYEYCVLWTWHTYKTNQNNEGHVLPCIVPVEDFNVRVVHDVCQYGSAVLCVVEYWLCEHLPV